MRRRLYREAAFVNAALTGVSTYVVAKVGPSAGLRVSFRPGQKQLLRVRSFAPDRKWSV